MKETNKPTDDKVWNKYNSDKVVNCPNCDEKVFRYVPINQDTEIDTIGSVKICSTEIGTYFHSRR